MRDEHDDRTYQALRHDLASNLGDIFKSVAYAFDRLHAHLYGAPWAVKTCEQPRSSKLTTL